jgi:DNA-binding transcriptional regulator YiaG
MYIGKGDLPDVMIERSAGSQVVKEFARRSKMTARKSKAPANPGEKLGLKLLRSVREMKARKFARVTEVEVNDVFQARQSTGMSQSEFASALNISKRTL